jgi:hypothetical protein
MNRWACRLPIVLLGCAVLFWLPVARGADSPATQPAASVPGAIPTNKFIRFVDRGDAGGELDTADVTFTNGKGDTVHLIAAVHIAERAYYDNLSKDFEGYDAVLYELIMPKDSLAPGGNGAGERSTSAISEFQLLLKRALDLEFQLDAIDYTKPNFVHADLDKETFEKMEADRGESIWTLILQQAMNQWKNPPPGAAPDLNEQMAEFVKLICRPDGDRQFKLVIARQMDDLEADAAGLTGPGGSVILTERNKACMKVLADTLAAGKKNIAIFYGAAHMPDMSQRLEDMGFTPTSVQWRMAWDLTIRPNQPSVVEKMLNALLDTGGQ